MDPVLRRYLSSLAAAGVRRVPQARTAAPGTGAQEASVVPPPVRGATTLPGLAPALEALSRPRPAADPAGVLEAIAQEVRQCTRCGLCQQRNNAVPGEGNPRAAIVFVGEGPGADEDRTGRPFVGRAGKLLDDIIVKGMHLERADVFICNVVKCRPPANRAPTPDETAACAPYLERQLEAIAPKVICALGATAARHLLDTSLSMTRLRGGKHHYRGIPVIPTYHPAYLLRNPAAKRQTWEDIQRVMEIAAES